jgi:SAM-dependent methyltransferase
VVEGADALDSQDNCCTGRIMGIETHAFNFIRIESAKQNLGSVLTIGRQSLDVSDQLLLSALGSTEAKGTFCEKALAALGATSVSSIDYSDYENPTYVADLSVPLELDAAFDTVIDGGSLEHIFDVACAFNNLNRLCKTGGRIFHFLPVNNLNGHGFWQFSSDLMYSIYSEKNGFAETKVYYASSLDHSKWYSAPTPTAGSRVEIVSIEPIILLSVSKKINSCVAYSVIQPLYINAWTAKSGVIDEKNRKNRTGFILRSLFFRKNRARALLRNLGLIFGLAVGRSRFSIRNKPFTICRVTELLRAPSGLDA